MGLGLVTLESEVIARGYKDEGAVEMGVVKYVVTINMKSCCFCMSEQVGVSRLSRAEASSGKPHLE